MLLMSLLHSSRLKSSYEPCFLVYYQRMMVNAQNQKDWADQQVREKKQAAF